MSNEEYLEQENKKKQSNQNYNIKNKQTKGTAIFFLIIAILSGLGGYKVIVYNNQSIEADKIAYQERQKEKADEINKKIATMDDKEKAIFDNLYEKKWDNTAEETTKKEEAYNKTLAQIEEEKTALQKKYDDQAKYEEWIAWQESEKRKLKKRKPKKKNYLMTISRIIKKNNLNKTNSKTLRRKNKHSNLSLKLMRFF